MRAMGNGARVGEERQRPASGAAVGAEQDFDTEAAQHQPQHRPAWVILEAEARHPPLASAGARTRSRPAPRTACGARPRSARAARVAAATQAWAPRAPSTRNNRTSSPAHRAARRSKRIMPEGVGAREENGIVGRIHLLHHGVTNTDDWSLRHLEAQHFCHAPSLRLSGLGVGRHPVRQARGLVSSRLCHRWEEPRCAS